MTRKVRKIVGWATLGIWVGAFYVAMGLSMGFGQAALLLAACTALIAMLMWAIWMIVEE